MIAKRAVEKETQQKIEVLKLETDWEKNIAGLKTDWVAKHFLQC